MADAMGPTKSVAENYTRYAQYFNNAKSGNGMSMDTFYKLLVSEMSNQDPMEPMSNTEFISQMANMTSLQTQKDALYYSNANYAQSLVGKMVTVAADIGKGLKSESGVVTSMSLAGGNFKVKVNGNDYLLSNVMEILPVSNPYVVNGSDGAYATSLIGKKVTVAGKNSEGATIIETGAVERIEIKDNEISVIIAGMAYPLSGVAKVENNTESNANSGENPETEILNGFLGFE